MKVIVPCGGRSSRFPGMAPKWMLPCSNGRPMITEAVRRLDFDLDDLIVTILREHDEKYDARAGLRAAFGRRIEVVVLDQPTASQPETVARTLQQTGLSEPFLVKDSDNSFALSDIEQAYNYVSVESLNHFDSINPRNKSYVRTNEAGLILSIVEKQVISDVFSVGGYFFRDPAHYLEAYRSLSGGSDQAPREIYTSDIIAHLIVGGAFCSTRFVSDYEDWGTIREWRQKLQRQNTYFVLIDGFIFGHGSAYFAPHYDQVPAIEEAVAATRQLLAEGHSIVFLSTRPESERQRTQARLSDLGLPVDRIIFDLPLGRYGIVSAPDASVPFSTAHALELVPSDPRLGMKLRFEN